MLFRELKSVPETKDPETPNARNTASQHEQVMDF